MMDKRNISTFNDLIDDADEVLQTLTDMRESIQKFISEHEEKLKGYTEELASINRQIEAIRYLNTLSKGDSCYEGMEDERD